MTSTRLRTYKSVALVCCHNSSNRSDLNFRMVIVIFVRLDKLDEGTSADLRRKLSIEMASVSVCYLCLSHGCK